MEVRRSVRLAPKTVANLASKFDNLLTNDSKAKLKVSNSAVLGSAAGSVTSASSNSKVSSNTTSSSHQKTHREMKLGKRDIAKIIGTLEKLDEEAKKASLILQKNSQSSKIISGKDSNSADVIDNLMKTTKSALEEVELPSESRRDHQELEHLQQQQQKQQLQQHEQQQQQEQQEQQHQEQQRQIQQQQQQVLQQQQLLQQQHQEQIKQQQQQQQKQQQHLQMQTSQNILEFLQPSNNFESKSSPPPPQSSYSSCTTDKYLQTLQKIAKENAETGQFRTSLQPKEMSSSCTSSSATGCSVITSAALDNSQLEKVNKIEWET